MLFNSIDFALFLPIVFLIYWLLPGKYFKIQNAFIVAASYFFYGWWDPRFLLLILFSTLVDFSVGKGLARYQQKSVRLALLWTSICVNLGFLGFFKYYNFFLDNFKSAFSLFGSELQTDSLHIILPVGISFYTFQTMSYSIDIYRRKFTPSNDLIAFSAYVSFFPQLVAGPIERASNLLPQFLSRRSFDYPKAVDGLRQILWGLFKKIVIADNCAVYADLVFNDPGSYFGSTLILGAFFFTIQIYSDFSGYSDIAIGTARLFGFNLMQNFKFPYFARDIAEFWRRWHISLSRWFRDYLYIPLGGSRGSTWMKIRNIFIIFIVSGFWHGANWTFIFWGFLNAVYFLPLLISNRHRRNIGTVAHGRVFPGIHELCSMGATFGLTVLAWIFFRAESLKQAFIYLSGIFSATVFNIHEYPGSSHAAVVLSLVGFASIIEWFGRDRQHALYDLGMNWHRLSRWSFYSLLVFLTGMFMQTEETAFIYFQF